MESMSTVDDKTALAREQAAGLRALADMITANPALAERLGFALGGMYAPLGSHVGDVRAVLETFYRAASEGGAAVTVDNGPQRCEVAAAFGPVTVSMGAKAEQMAGEQPRTPKYTPLAVGMTAGA
jgi:hypothetical protein